jgi:hypothetical protein
MTEGPAERTIGALLSRIEGNGKPETGHCKSDAGRFAGLPLPVFGFPCSILPCPVRLLPV